MNIAALLLCAAACSAAPSYRAEIVDCPRRVVEGRPFAVTIAYRVPADRAIALRLELKIPSNEVLQQASQTIRGEGRATLELTGPPVTTARTITVAAWMGDDWTQSPCGIVASPAMRVLSTAEGAMEEQQRAEAAGRREALRREATPAGLVGLFAWRDAEPAGLADALARRLRQAGIGAVVLDEATVANAFVLTPDTLDMLVLCDSRTVPGPAIEAIRRYAETGGNLTVLGGPAFSRTLWPVDGQWLPREQVFERLVAALEPNVKADFDTSVGGTWTRGTNDGAARGEVVAQTGGARDGAGCARIEIGNLTGWDTFEVPLDGPLFDAGESWLTFAAKGAAATRQMVVELRERDGSRWMAVVNLTGDWRSHALPPEAFRYWQDSASTGRGGPGDQVRPDEVAAVVVGLAFTHTTGIAGGAHTIWLDSLGAAAAPANAAQIRDFARGEVEAPILEAVSPSYKLFEVTNLEQVVVGEQQLIAEPLTGEPPAATLAMHPRPNGTGLRKERRWRQQPLLECRDRQGRFVGSAASLTIVGCDPNAGGITVSMPTADPAYLRRPPVEDWLVKLIGRVLDGVFLYEGGAAYYASFGAEAMPVGARVTNRGNRPATVTAKVEIREQGQWRWGSAWTVELAPGEDRRVEATWDVPAGRSGPYQVIVTLERDGRAIDRLEHEVRVWQPPAEPNYVSTRDGDFWWRGRKWYPHGVNYMPSSGIGIEDGPYFEYYLDPQPYDPEIISRDLDDCVAIGFNMISIFQYHRSLAGRNLLDLLMRCEERGLKVNLSLRPGTPIDFPWDLVQPMIEDLRLAENDTVFAYDLAWEPQWGNHAMRLPHDPAWAAWVERTYGTIAAAEAAWGHPAPTVDGRLTNPTDEQASTPATFDRLMLDYRRFLNELLHERYGRARELVRGIDPNHAVSFRMSEAGNPTVAPSWLAYDFAGLANAVDIFCPEGYGRIGDWEKVKPGWFTTAYARAVNPALPVMWAEFGYTSWDMATMRQNPERLAFITQFYDDFYQMAYRSGANGTVCWWFPGGFRVGENSDYGVLNPDRSWREVTRVIRRWAPRMTAPRIRPQPDVLLDYQAAQPWGLHGIYRQHGDAFWRAVDEGRTPGLRRVDDGGAR